MGPLTLLAVISVLTCFLNSGSAAAPQQRSTEAGHETVTLQWRTNLRSAIGSAPIWEDLGSSVESKARPRTSLWFTDNRTIVATFVTREGNPSLSNRDASDATLPLRLRPVFLDAATGKVTATPDWPTISTDASIIAVHDGKLVTLAGDELTLYGPDLKVLKKLKLPSPPPSGWYVHRSPSGKNILILVPTGTYSPTHWAYSWLWLETDSLRIAHSWEDTDQGEVAIADNKMVMIQHCYRYGDTGCKPHIKVRGIDTDWISIAPSDKQYDVQFVNEDAFLLSGEPVRLMQVDGKVIFQEVNPLGEGGCWIWPMASPTGDGQRFVVPAGVQKGAFPALDIYGHELLKKILVYDAPFHARSYTLDYKGPPIKDPTHFALSPDGLQLAILDGESVEVLHLPPALH